MSIRRLPTIFRYGNLKNTISFNQSSSPMTLKHFMSNVSINDNEEDIENDDLSKKTLISDIISKYNSEYSTDCVISAAQSIPNYKYLYIIQLINPFNNLNKINIIGIKQESITQQNEIAIEIRKLLHLIKPQTLIVQLSKERYQTHLNNMDINDIDNLIPKIYSIKSLLSPKYLIHSTRIGLHLINYICMNQKIRMNPYLYALLYANNEKNECNFIENIILGDIESNNNNNNNNILNNGYKYLSSTTYKQRKEYGRYPGIFELLFSINSVKGVYEWINLNKNTIKLKEKDVHQFAIDLQNKLEIGKDILETSAKSMSYYTYKAAQKHNNDNHNILVLCNIFTMLSIPTHFGNIINKEEIISINNNNNNKNNNYNIYKKWIFNYWNGFWWSLCFMHTLFQTGIYNMDYLYLLQFGIGFPILYPSIYIFISFRARNRVRKLQKIIIENEKNQQQQYVRKSSADHTFINVNSS